MKKGLLTAGVISIGLMLGACGSDGAENASASSEEQQETDQAEKFESLFSELESLAAKGDIAAFSMGIKDLKKLDLSNDEKLEILKIVDQAADQAIAEKDPDVIKKNAVEFKRFTEFAEGVTDRNYTSEVNQIAIAEYEKREAASDSKLDELEAALKNRDFSTVEQMYGSEPAIQENHEASAMYHYAQYLKKNEHSYEASLDLALNVPYTYNGRFKDEIAQAVLDTSYVTPTTFPGPIDDYFWQHPEQEAASAEKIVNDMANLKKEGERMLDEARGKNPTIGMTAAQVEVSNWGLPEKINRTVTQSTTREQWVYGNGQYLYFTDGILTSFQD